MLDPRLFESCRVCIYIPLLPSQGLAFVGSEVVTFDALTTNGLQAEWVASLLKVGLFRGTNNVFYANPKP